MLETANNLVAEGYKPENILVIGGCGFIASHVATRLAKNYPEYKVVVLDKMDYCASIENLSSVTGRPNFKFIKGDIQSMDLLSFVLLTEKIDTIMHFAAQTHVDNSFGNSLAFAMNNTHGTHVMLEAARMTGTIRRFINVSTDEVYGETSLGKEFGLAEHSKLKPTNPYSAAKAGAEMMCKAYLTSYKLSHHHNTWDQRVWASPARGADLPIHGDGLAVRSYLFVEDVAAAFDTVLHKGEVGKVYNIGTEKEHSVLDDRAFNDRRYYIGNSKLHALGWREHVSWEEGLRKTIDWYLNTTCSEYWQGELEAALKAHPVLVGTNIKPTPVVAAPL
ncbi:hypothetical protein OEZ85_003264 [Tetradesmus obliquus]|uniref:NAD(P)-binding domain-containing protein n=1 Tax=Tetradesmus obliquus TaxID=3088 RepID=A0ABY8U0P4_TETOB|nr:hypothetical protein OEZ85_003264 [Tetradesmus obliquus]